MSKSRREGINVRVRGVIAANVVTALLVACITTGLVAYDGLGVTGRMITGVGAFAAFGALFVPAVRPHALTARRVVALSALMVVVAVIMVPRDSDDIWSYTMNGRLLSVHGVNPFTSVPADFRGDPMFHLVGRSWRHIGSLYGPVFAALAGAATAVTGTSVLANRLFFQVIEAIALAGGLALVWRRTRDPVALAFLGLNPAVFAVVNGGHNDLLVAVALLAGTFLLLDGRSRAAGAVLASGALVKLVVIVPIAALLIWAWRRNGAPRTRPAVAIFAIIVAGAYAIAGGAAALGPLEHARHFRGRSAVWQLLRRWLLEPLGVSSTRVSSMISVVALVTVALVALLVGVGAVRSRSRSMSPDVAAAVVAGSAALAFLLGAAYVLPWYSAWTVPLLALAWQSRVAVVAVAQSAFVTLAYAGTLHSGAVFLLYAHAFVPLFNLAALVYLVVSIARDRLGDPMHLRIAPNPIPRMP